jgi:DDE superfamily endonuclease
MWVLPPAQSGEVVAQMEAVLAVSQQPYDPQVPLVCMDEQPVPLIKALRKPLPAKAGQPARDDAEDERHGTATIFMVIEPRRGVRRVGVREHKTAVDWATAVQQFVDHQYPEADRSRLVCDHLNTHGSGALDEAFPPAQARRLASRLELHYTPKHGSWRTIAESERSALTLQCLERRIPDLERLRGETQQWEQRRNASQKGVDWQFSTHDARIKLKRLYPQMQS